MFSDLGGSVSDVNKVNVNDRIKLFLDNNTYIFIKLISGKFLNGYITAKNKGTIDFKDDLMGDIPLLINEIEIIDYSDKLKGGNDGPD